MSRGRSNKQTWLRAAWILIRKIGLLPRYLKDPQTLFWKKIMVVLGIVYVVSPFDILPDPVLGLGFIDDAVLITYIMSRISDELEKYLPSEISKEFDKEKIIDDVDYKIDDE